MSVRKPSPPAPWVPPVQRRSREKLERVLEAAEALLEDRLFESLSMAELAERAGVSVGMLYTRFRSKEDLLPALFQRHHLAVEGRLRALFEALGRQRSLRRRVQTVVDFAVEYHRVHRGLLRALTAYTHAHPDSVPARVFTEREAQYAAVGEAIVGGGDDVVRRGRGVRAAFALGTINAVCRERILFEESNLENGGDRELRVELARMTHTYLTTSG